MVRPNGRSATVYANLTDADMDRALNEGAILRTHALRPTWQFVLPEDIRWILELTSPRIHAKNTTAYRAIGLDSELGKKSNRLIERALQGGNHMTRKELREVLGKGGIETDSRRSAYLMMYAEIEGVVCSGALAGKQQTYALIDERAPNARQLTPDEALAELTLRYFRSHGPATVRDFVWWSSLKVADIRRGLEIVGEQLTHEEIGGATYWFAKRGPRMRVNKPTVHVMQALDEYLVGYSETKHLLNISKTARPFTDRTFYFGVVMADGQVAGNWKRTITKSKVKFDILLYRLFRGERLRALEKSVADHGKFLGLPAEFTTTRFSDMARK